MYHDYTAGGFQPVCAPTALPYNLPLWYSSHGDYENIDHTHPTLTTETSPLASVKENSIISVRLKDWDFSTPPKKECLRLCVGVAFPEAPPTEDEESEYCERVCYSVILPAGQDPGDVFIGWTTPEFRYIEEQFESNAASFPGDVQYGQRIDLIGRSEVAHYSTAFMTCLSDLLDAQESLQVLPYALT